jgi:hypothetical protein
VQYETTDPTFLPDAARQLATSPDAYKTAARFGVGVCSLGADSSGKASSRSLSHPTNRVGPASGEFSGSENRLLPLDCRYQAITLIAP